MFYMANAVLLSYGYKTQDKIAHKVTSDALIVLDKLKKELLEDYEAIQKDALEIVSAKAESVIESYSLELDKRSRFQYNMLEQTKEAKAQTSLKRASEFVFEIKKGKDQYSKKAKKPKTDHFARIRKKVQIDETSKKETEMKRTMKSYT